MLAGRIWITIRQSRRQQGLKEITEANSKPWPGGYEMDEQEDIRMVALRVLRKHCTSEEQFMEEVEMLGLDDLVSS